MTTSKKGNQTKQNIITSAKILFYEHGYNKTGIQDIADHADVKLGTITSALKGKLLYIQLFHSKTFVCG